jgi:galactonate dehydratase
MKTTGFRTFALGTPWRNLSYIVIETDEGITGVGEARVLGKTHTVAEYLKDVERHFIGHDPFNIEALYRRMTLLDFGKPGEVVYTGLAMVELAFWDIIGKATGQPVYKLLGGQVKDRVQAYANGWYTVERHRNSRPDDDRDARQVCAPPGTRNRTAHREIQHRVD